MIIPTSIKVAFTLSSSSSSASPPASLLSSSSSSSSASASAPLSSSPASSVPSSSSLSPPITTRIPNAPFSSLLSQLGRHALSLSSSSTSSTSTNPSTSTMMNASNNLGSCSILATSSAGRPSSPAALLSRSAVVNNTSVGSKISPTGRVWLSDRRGPFDHFKPKSLLLSTTRVSILQASSVLSGFITEQLERELEREELLVQGKITSEELDRQNAEWEETEWISRWKSYPKRAVTAILRFHAVTLLSRFYETIVFQWVLRFTPPTLDRLTKDPFQSALRKKERLHQYQRSGPSRFRITSPTNKGTSNTTTPKSTRHTTNIDDIQSRRDLGYRMLQTCFYSNVVSFLADHTVQQCLLAYGYYIYYRQKKKASRFKRLKKEEQRLLSSLQSVGDGDGVTEASSASSLSTDSSDFGDGERGGIFVSFLHRSTRICVSRGLGLGAASMAGAVGSVVYPGWGTTVGIQLGDALVGNLLED